MKGFFFGDIKWSVNGLGYQLVKLPPQQTYDSRGRPVGAAIKQSHVKVWRRIGGGNREFVCRKPTVKAAKAFVKSHLL